MHGLYHGVGVLQYKDIKAYEGQWVQGKPTDGRCYNAEHCAELSGIVDVGHKYSGQVSCTACLTHLFPSI